MLDLHSPLVSSSGSLHLPVEYYKLKIYHDGHNNIILELTIGQLNKCSPNELPIGAVFSDTHIVQCVIRQFQLNSHVSSGKHHILRLWVSTDRLLNAGTLSELDLIPAC